jgi:hypothetical protein
LTYRTAAQNAKAVPHTHQNHTGSGVAEATIRNNPASVRNRPIGGSHLRRAKVTMASPARKHADPLKNAPPLAKCRATLDIAMTD